MSEGILSDEGGNLFALNDDGIEPISAAGGFGSMEPEMDGYDADPLGCVLGEIGCVEKADVSALAWARGIEANNRSEAGELAKKFGPKRHLFSDLETGREWRTALGIFWGSPRV